MPTNCMDCGRELVPQTIPGAWRCGACIEAAKEKPMRPAGSRLPELEDDRPDFVRAELQDEPERVSGEVLEPHDGPPGRAVEKPAPAPGAALVRAEPSWRELGHWLGLAEADDGSAASMQAGAALRLYMLHQMDLPLWAAPALTMIRGKLYLSAELVRYLAVRAGYEIVRTDSSDEACTATLVRVRTGRVLGACTFTIDDARRANLMRAGSPWITYPARMLWARASKYVVQDFAPEVLMGLGTADEADELRGLEAEPIGIDPPYATQPPDLEGERDEDIPF